MRKYSVSIKCKDQKKLELITLRIAFFTMEDSEEIEAALEAGEISLNGDSNTSISINNGKAIITFNNVSYMDLPNVFDDPSDSEMFEIFKSCGLIAGASVGFEADFTFCDDWAGYDHHGYCKFNGTEITYIDFVNLPEGEEGINHHFSAELSGDDFINETKEAFYRISGEPVYDESTGDRKEKGDSFSLVKTDDFPDDAESEKQWMAAFGKYVTHTESLPFQGKICVVAGAERRSDWDQIEQKLIAAGAVFRTAVSGKTDYLIVDPKKTLKRKSEDAVIQINAGKSLKIVLIDDVIKSLDQAKKKANASKTPTSKTTTSKKSFSNNTTRKSSTSHTTASSNKASNMMELMKAKFASMSKEDLSLTIRKAGDELTNAFALHAAEVGDIKLVVAGVMLSRVCVKLGFCTRRLSQKQQWLLKEICPNAIEARKSMAEFVVEPIEDNDYKLVGMFTEKIPDRQIIQSMFDMIMSAAYVDGGLKPQVEKKIDPMFGMLFLGAFFDSGLESVPAPRRKVTGLEARVLDVMLKDGTMMSLKDISKALPGETQTAIKAALGELCEKDLVNYYDSTILGETYGVNVERGDVDIVLEKTEEEIKAEKEEKRRKAEEARRKAEENPLSTEEAEELLKKAEARRIAAVEAKKESLQYEQNVDKWKSDCEEIEAKRTAFVCKKIAEEKEKLVSAATKKRDTEIETANTTIKQQTEIKAAAEKRLASLGMFKFSEKKHKRQ